ncbi:MAG: peroxidase [Gemmataceae bacterium]|nr:peroxidase [Gemmataceae bacterium]
MHRVSLDAELAAQLGQDYTQATLDEADLAMLDYTAKLTRNAVRVTPPDLDRLRAVGFSDQAILQINLIASWFNYINRVADGLGVGRA